MKRLLVLGLLLAVVACAQQQPPAATAPPPAVAAAPPPAYAPPPPPPPAARTSFDGLYKGTMSLAASKQTTETLTGGGCPEERPVNMRVKRGDVRIWYQDYKRHTLHYRGKIDATGKVDAYHTEGGGSRAILAGQFSNGEFTADLNRGRCAYTVTMTKA